MNVLKKILGLSIATMLLSVTLFADETPVFIRGIRPLGMGGAFVAISDDQNAIFYNPAGLTQRQGSQLVAFELPVNISEDVLNFYNFYNDRKDQLDKFDTLSNEQKINLLDEINDRVTTYRPRIRLGFPNTSYLSGNQNITWGVGVFDQAEIGFQFNRSLIIPSVSLFGNVDAILAIPLAHRFDCVPYLPGKLSVGTTLKAIQRYNINEPSISILEFENFDPQLQAGKGFGLDVGTLYQPNGRWNVGLQITDLGGTTIKYDAITASKEGQLDRAAHSNMINSQWNTGVAYIPSKIYYWPGKSIATKDRIIFAGDLRDILNTDDRLFDATGWKKVHLGAELRWGPLSIRGGFNSGWPTFGGGLRIPYLGLRADYAYWADETGRFAGQMPEWNHQITIALSWGDAKGRAYGTDVKSECAVDQKKKPELPVPAKPAPKVTAPAITPPYSATKEILPIVPTATPVASPAASPTSTPVTAPVTTSSQAPATTPAVVPAVTPPAPVGKPVGVQPAAPSTATEKR
jgi:hypothetical protein